MGWWESLGRLRQRGQRTQGPCLARALLWVERAMLYSGMLVGMGDVDVQMCFQRQGWD